MRKDSYIYVHLNIKTKEVFYVGLGTGKKYERSYSYKNRNKIWNNYINKYNGFLVQILYKNISREEAIKLEIDLIKEFGRICDKTGVLTNISLGGDKTFYGIIRTNEHSAKIATSNRGRIASDETRKRQSEKRIGIKLSDETKKKMSISGKGRIVSVEARNKISIGNMGNKKCLGRNMSLENKRALSKKNSIKIICINNSKTYNSALEAAMDLKISDKHIGSVCKGNRNHTKGYKFKYAA